MNENTTTNTARIDHIDELARAATHAACDLRSTLQWNYNDANAIAAALRKYNEAANMLAAYADGVLDAAEFIAKTATN